MGVLSLRRQILMAQPHKETVVGTNGIATFDTDFKAKIPKIVIPFTPVQEGTGDPSPNNVRPISGWTGCEITQASAEDLIELVPRQIEVTGLSVSINSDSVSVTGQTAGNRIYKLCSGNTKTFPAGTYTIYCDNPDIYVGTSPDESTFTSNIAIRTAVEAFLMDNIRIIIRPNIIYDGVPFHVYLFAGSVNVAPTVIPITFTDPSTGDPMTIYGGTVTLNEDLSADLVVNRELINITGTEQTSKYYSQGSANQGYIAQFWPTGASTKKYADVYGNLPNYGPFSNMLKIGPSGSFNSYGMYDCAIYGSYVAFRIFETKKSRSLEEIKARIVELGGIQVVGRLATPKSYHFDNIGQLKSFIGTNNVWSDLNGDPTVTFWQHG